MKPKNILKSIGYTAGVFVLVIFLAYCSKVDQIPFVDFVIDLTDPQYSTLLNLGGYVHEGEVIVFHGIDNNYYALSKFCTQDGCDLQYAVAQNEITCPCDASKYDLHGAVIMGPASSPLYEYLTQLTGTQLHIYTP
jgi:Rieske Fe-S protein